MAIGSAFRIPGGQPPPAPYGSQQYFDNERTKAAQAKQRQFEAEKAVGDAGRAGVAARQSGHTLNGDPYQYETDGSGAGRTAAPGPNPADYISYGDVNRFAPKPVPREVLPPPVTPPPKADRTAANAAAFGRAKDRIGKQAGGAMKALQRQMSIRGISGSGIESAGIGDVLGRSVEQLGEVTRDQTLEDLRRDQDVEDRDFNAALGQRNTNMNFGTTQRGQDIDQNAQQQQYTMTMLRALMQRNGGRLY